MQNSKLKIASLLILCVIFSLGLSISLQSALADVFQATGDGLKLNERIYNDNEDVEINDWVDIRFGIHNDDDRVDSGRLRINDNAHITGALNVDGSVAAGSITAAGQAVCLQDGTNCQAAADTLQTVTARGNSTSGGLVVNGQTINHEADNFLFINSYNGIQLRVNSDGSGVQGFNINNGSNATVFTVANGGAVTASGGITSNGNIESNGTYYLGDNKRIVDFNDAWLRLNPNNHFTNGIYTPSYFRADGGVEFRSMGAAAGRVLTSTDNNGKAAWTKFSDNIRFCIDSCGNGFNTAIGGWADTEAIKDYAWGPGCTGTLQDQGDSHMWTYLCVKN